MASARSGNIAVFLAAAMLCGACAAQDVGANLVAQARPRPGQLPAGPERPARTERPAEATGGQQGTNVEDCQRRWADYERSQACFAPYHTVNGIRPEAFTACGQPLRDPSAECGPPLAR